MRLPRHTPPIAPLLAGLTTLLHVQTALSITTEGWTADPLSPHNAGSHHLEQRQEPRLGAVASQSSICSQIGVDLLREGGNAADALVGTVFCIGVVAMYHSGIGGGGFVLARRPNGTYETLDFRETAPAAAYQDMYKDNPDASIFGGLAPGVPGEIRGLENVHNKYGKLPWEQVMRPAIKVAREGYPVTEDLVHYMNSAMTPTNRFLETDPTWALDFAPNGTLVALGQNMTRKRYADTLETIATRGPDAFYSGPIASTMIQALQAKNGTMTLQDVKNYTVAFREPQAIEYRGYQVHSCPAPSSGSVVLAVMKIVEGFPDFGEASAVNLSTHRLVEAMRWGYGLRTELGDPSFTAGIEAYGNEMISAEVAAQIRVNISDLQTQNVSVYDPNNIDILNTPGTSAIVAADASGLAFSLTTTINLLFGSQLMVPETGVIMNNQMNDFSIPGVPNAFGYEPSEANFIRPGKRPLSSISPTIVDRGDGSLYLVIGSAGGSRIITAVIQGVWHVLDQNMTAPQALAAPRLHDQLVPNNSLFEYAYDNVTVEFMRERGHNVTWVAPGLSTAQALRYLANGTWEAASEPRQVNSGGFAV